MSDVFPPRAPDETAAAWTEVDEPLRARLNVLPEWSYARGCIYVMALFKTGATVIDATEVLTQLAQRRALTVPFGVFLERLALIHTKPLELVSTPDAFIRQQYIECAYEAANAKRAVVGLAPILPNGPV